MGMGRFLVFCLRTVLGDAEGGRALCRCTDPASLRPIGRAHNSTAASGARYTATRPVPQPVAPNGAAPGLRRHGVPPQDCPGGAGRPTPRLARCHRGAAPAGKLRRRPGFGAGGGPPRRQPRPAPGRGSSPQCRAAAWCRQHPQYGPAPAPLPASADGALHELHVHRRLAPTPSRVSSPLPALLRSRRQANARQRPRRPRSWRRSSRPRCRSSCGSNT